MDTITPPSKDVSALRANADHPLIVLGKIIWDDTYLYMNMMQKKSSRSVTPDLVGIETIPMALGNSRARLVLVLKDKSNWELFYSICNDLLNATRLIKKPLQRWTQYYVDYPLAGISKTALTFFQKKKLRVLLES